MSGEKVHVGIYMAPDIPQSFRVYVDNVLRYLPLYNVMAMPFSNPADLPRTADVLWDIRSGGGNPPLEFMLGGAPLVVTVHGFAPITLPPHEYFDTFWERLSASRHARRKLARWRQFNSEVAALIAVSEFSRQEAARLTGVPLSKIHVCHHGVDAEAFRLDDINGEPHNYFLHISNNEPRKNISRIVSAFQAVRKQADVELVLKLPLDQAPKYQGIQGVRVVGGMLDIAELAALYRQALGFVFPSLYEGFGLPILEAMASGCPVITSNVSACPEVAGNAAIIINPRDKAELYQAMMGCLESATRHQWVESGLARVRAFTWSDSAAGHARVLRGVVAHGKSSSQAFKNEACFRHEYRE